jgi:branched-chain amino acid transport system ATP-binding protein
MLRRLKDEGMSLLLVEQNVELALDLADRVAILDQGAKVFEGPAAALKADDAVIARYLGVGV